MPIENETFDQKSIRYVLGVNQKMVDLACDCVGLANARGGVIYVGFEDKADAPPVDQKVSATQVTDIQRRLPQLTVNVAVVVTKQSHSNSADYIRIDVARCDQSVASTSDGRYFIRIADETKPLLPDQISRLMVDRSAFSWELAVMAGGVSDAAKKATILAALRSSDRVKAPVKSKTDAELLEHYNLTIKGKLTNLGVMWIGDARSRAALSNAPVIQAIKFDEHGKKTRKWAWDDYTLNPMELIDAAWREIPEWQETYELPDGLLRTLVPHYAEAVVRELLVNALAHRPYNTGGAIFINLYPDRLEVHNPGLLPVGITPQNILHETEARNVHLVRVMHDLKLMEREGSGFDMMYKALLSTGRRVPVVVEGNDRVSVTIYKKIIRPEIIEFMKKVEKDFQPSSREMLVLGTLAQNESMSAKDLATALELGGTERLNDWLGKLREWGLVTATGKTKGVRYQVKASVLRKVGFKGQTSLKRVEVYRVRELILEDLKIHERSSRPEIHARIGAEIPEHKLRLALKALIDEGVVLPEGQFRWRLYVLVKKGSKSGA